MIRTKLIFVTLCVLGLFAGNLSAAFVLQNGEEGVDAKCTATFPLEVHYNMGVNAMNCCDWHEAAKQFHIASYNFPSTALGQEAFFYLGVAYYNLEDYDFANDAFSSYLKAYNTPQYFEEAIEYKFKIANLFRCGAKKRLFGFSCMPKWSSGSSLAIEIYDEVIVSMPCHELAVQSLYIKACLLWQNGCFRESVDTYHQLIRRFPKHELAPASYLNITKVYLEQTEIEFQNSDLLELANVVVRKFEIDFPGDPRVGEAESNLQKIKEIYACGLFETGRFYERTLRPCAAILYYKKALSCFPDTNVAQYCYQRIRVLEPYGVPTDAPIALPEET